MEEEVKYRIIVCENCYKIPEITFLNQTHAQLKCQQCISLVIKDFSYFNNKYYKSIEKEDWIEMPKCNYNKNHQLKSVLYCFQCEKYLCEECINIHNISFEDKEHIFIKQRINNNFYCKKTGHTKFIKYRYCTLCKDYLCSQCKCEHNDLYIYDLERCDGEKKIKEVINNIKKLKKIIEDEEIKFNIFLEEIENKIKALKIMFNNYKERNMNAIKFYELLINNYRYFNNIYDYNIINNIIINDNFDFSISKGFSNENNQNKNECFTSKYNKLYSFYKNKFHIKIKEYSNFYFTKNFCNKNNIKKCIFVNEKLISFIFSNDNYIYFIDKENSNKILKKEIECQFIKDIYALNTEELIFIDENNFLHIYNIKDNKNICITTKYEEKDFKFIIPNLIKKDKLFMIHDNKDYFAIYYYINNKNIPLIYKENKFYDIKCLFKEINKIISESYINLEDEKKIKSLFVNKTTQELINIYELLWKIYNIDIKTNKSIKLYKNLLYIYGFAGNITDQMNTDEIDKDFLKEYGIQKMTSELIKLDKNLLEILECLLKELFDKNKNIITDYKENNYVINSNYIYNIIKKELNNSHITLSNNILINLKYILHLNELCYKIRKRYFWCIALNSDINNIYNFNNEYLIFMGENYLLLKYLIKEKEFIPIVTSNFISNKEKNYNNYEIKHISSKYFILNNFKEKIVKFIDTNNFFILKKQFNYYHNIFANDNYLLFDTINENEIQFSFINLEDFSKENNNKYLIKLFNLKIYYYFPKILLNSNFENIIYLYENNQLCIAEYKYKKNNYIIYDKNKKIKNITIKKNANIIPKINDCSEVYSQNYDASNLFSNDEDDDDIINYYYCSKYPSNQYIIFEFIEEYFLGSFEMIYLSRKKECKPKNIKVTIFDNNKNITKILEFINNDIDSLSNKYILKNKGKYLRVDFINNFGGDYIIIKKINFYANPIDSVIFE